MLDFHGLCLQTIHVCLVSSDVGEEDVTGGGLIEVGRDLELEAATFVTQWRLSLDCRNSTHTMVRIIFLEKGNLTFLWIENE